MVTARCPICARQFDPEQATAMPFCSERCRQIDLGKWLDEEYGFPLEPDDGEGAERRPRDNGSQRKGEE